MTKPGKKVNISRIPSSISLRPSKKVLEKYKFYKGNNKIIDNQANTQSSHSYVQTSKINIKDIMKIKDNFLNLSVRKIKKVHKVLNMPKNEKSRLNIMTKSPWRRQVLVLMSLANLQKFMIMSSKHVVNINRVLKDIKSDTMANFIWADSNGLMIITNKVTSTLNYNSIKKYIKNIDAVDSNDIISPRLP